MREQNVEPQFKIRQMHEDDLLYVTYIAHQDGKYDAWSERVFNDCLLVEYPCFVAVTAENEIAGFCIMSIDLMSAHILNIAVNRIYRGLGIGTLLMQHMLAIAKEFDVWSVKLEVSVNNIVAQQLYQKFNFKEISIKTNYYTLEPGVRGDAYLYELKLPESQDDEREIDSSLFLS